MQNLKHSTPSEANFSKMKTGTGVVAQDWLMVNSSHIDDNEADLSQLSESQGNNSEKSACFPRQLVSCQKVILIRLSTDEHVIWSPQKAVSNPQGRSGD